MIKKWIISGVTGTLLTTSSIASATSLIKQDFNDMVKSASACVVAEKVKAVYLEEQGSMYTLTTFKVSSTAFGDTDETITVRTPGGAKKLGKLSTTEVVAGAPQFFYQQESLLLLNEMSSGQYSVTGFSQGVFPVLDTPQGDMITLPEDLGGQTELDEALELIAERRTAPQSSINVL